MIEKLKLELHLANKPLPKTPSKFKILKEKTKSKFQNLIKKTKLQSQELIAGIEVKTKQFRERITLYSFGIRGMRKEY